MMLDGYLSWAGSEETFVDQPDVTIIKNIAVGRFGGNSSAGQYKNEDGCLVWANSEQDWEFVMILDGHKTAESVELVIKTFDDERRTIGDILSMQITQAFDELEAYIKNLFTSDRFREESRQINGETACLIVLRKEKFLWWFSIGDNLLCLFYKDLIALGQYAVNQRHFYEWVGVVSTFDLSVPCYTTGRKELRQGVNHIFLTTDGLLECPGEPYDSPEKIPAILLGASNTKGVEKLLKDIQTHQVRDSTTIVSWQVSINEKATIPSDL